MLFKTFHSTAVKTRKALDAGSVKSEVVVTDTVVSDSYCHRAPFKSEPHFNVFHGSLVRVEKAHLVSSIKSQTMQLVAFWHYTQLVRNGSFDIHGLQKYGRNTDVVQTQKDGYASSTDVHDTR